MKILINLATLRRGGGMTHVTSFLPELINRLPAKPTLFVHNDMLEWANSMSPVVFTHTTPPGSLKLAYVQQWQVRKLARNYDLLISVMNTGPVKTNTPQVICCCNVLHFTKTNSLVATLQNKVTMIAMNKADLCIFPSMGAMQMATEAGFNNRNDVIHHPLRDHLSPWQKPHQDDGTLKIFVPGTNQPHKNLSLLPEISKILSSRDIKHTFNLTMTEEDSPAFLHEMKLSIHFIGRYSQEQLHAIICKNDIALIPSLFESYSYSLVELEQAGMPIAVSNIPVHQEISAYASLFEPHSATSAADAILAASRGVSYESCCPHPSIESPADYADKFITICKELAP